MAGDFTQALGRLLTEAPLRSEFRADPHKTAGHLGLGGSELEALAGIGIEDLERQAECLIQKRFTETRKRMPRTFQALGDEGLRRFRRFSERPWPKGHDRHLKDAVAFGDFLLDLGVRAVSQWELHQLRFELTKKRWALRWAADAPVGDRSGGALQLLWRTLRGDVRTAGITLGLPRRRRS